MSKLIKLEWIKFTQNRKNRLVILLLILYILGLVVYNNVQYNNYFPMMEKAMKEEKNYASSELKMIELFSSNDENYKVNPLELEYLNIEIRKSTILEYHYREKDFTDWEKILQTENDKFSNLILGEENKFIHKNLLNARGQSPLGLKARIMENEYLIKEKITPYINPYELNGVNFLVLLLKGYTPIIIIILLVLLFVDVLIGEMEEGSYKVYFTQPFSRRDIYWSKILSILLFTIGILSIIIVVAFIIISLIYGLGDFRYPQIIGSSKALLSLASKTNLLGEFQIVSTLKYLILGYLLSFAITAVLIIFIIALSMLLKSISATIGAFTSIIMLYYAFDIFLENESILRFYFPLSYMKVEQVLNGQINTSYIVGITIALACSILIPIFICRKFTNNDLLGGAK